LDSDLKLDGGAQPIFQAARLSLQAAPPPQVTIAAYGYMAEVARQAALKLAYEDEIFAEIVVFSQLLPVNIPALRDSIQDTKRLLVIEEGTLTAGWGAEVIASISEQFGDSIRQAVRVAGRDSPIPASSALERAALPDIDDIILAVKKMV
jgi:pyruvate/2-oxoglutarate/acetoin dehydrogenase E1 component